MPAEFRPARPGDVEAALPLIYASGPAAFEYVFGPSCAGGARSYLRAAFLDGAGQFGWRNHVVGVRGGEVVAAGGGWDSSTEIPFLLAALRQFWGQFSLGQVIATAARGLITETVIRPPKKGEFYVGQLGVRADLRGIGVGGALLSHLVEAGRARGFHKIVLDVASTNPRAEALYARSGFRITAERQRNLRNQFGEVVLHKRMERDV